MTAIAGHLTFGASVEAARHCSRMLHAQQVHAPDVERIWNDESIAVGRRLYPLLPEDRFDRGPVVSDDSERVLVADLRLDNRDELCRDLGLADCESRSLADAAILMRALERWGERALDRIVGDFAFAWWNGRDRRLVLARDFLGQRPLHFHRGDGFVAFASMPKGLHALAEIPRVPNRQTAADFVALMPETGTESFFEGVEKVAPGEVVTITADGLSRRRYWEPSGDELRLGGADEYVEALRELLDLSVSSRLRGAGNCVAATLSGGLDSSAVAATAARLLSPVGGTVVALTGAPRLGYGGRGVGNSFIDESRHAAAVAALYPNMEHVVVRAGAVSPLDDLDRYFFLYERPFLNLCNGVWTVAIQRTLKQRGLSVLLGGSMGNLSFSYDGMAFLSQLAAKGRLLRFAREAWLLHRNGMRWGTIGAQTLGPFLPASLWRGISRLRGKRRRLSDYTALNPAAAERLGVTARAASLKLDTSYRPRADPRELRLWALRRSDPGNYNKGALAAWGIDGRDPTADRRLVEFCLRVPMDQFLADGMTRSLARRALADRLPDEVRLERRKGYQAADWHEGLEAAREQLKFELDRIGNTPVATDVLDTPRMRQLFEDWPEGGWHEDPIIAKYRMTLLRGVSAGHFLRRAAGSNQ